MAIVRPVQTGAQQAAITRRYKFAASHRLHSDRLSPEENQRVFGKCNNPNGHGHNYIVYVTVHGPIHPRSGQVTDAETLDRLVTESVVDRFDHRDLNLDPGLSGRITTGENLVQFIWDLLVDKIPGGSLQKIGLVETRDNYFEYTGEP
jgi:6-pyruvoyltetrahydropterin/6-carboxytetrahydropterin synthase